MSQHALRLLYFEATAYRRMHIYAILVHIYSPGVLNVRRVIKIGTSSILKQDGELSAYAINNISQGVRHLSHIGDHVILVVSGAVGVGRYMTAEASSSRSTLAAIGQPRLIAAYQSALAPLITAQLLVSADHFAHLPSALVLQDSLHHLWKGGIVPLINENDAVNVGASRVGDNDTLAALVATLIHADQLVLLSDVDGLYTENPRNNSLAQRIPYVPWVGPHHLSRYGGSAGPLGSGGMHTKLKAAQIAQHAGIETILMSGKDPHVWSNLQENNFGQATHFGAREEACHA